MVVTWRFEAKWYFIATRFSGNQQRRGHENGRQQGRCDQCGRRLHHPPIAMRIIAQASEQAGSKKMN
jgi:hypothetical protein